MARREHLQRRQKNEHDGFVLRGELRVKGGVAAHLGVLGDELKHAGEKEEDVADAWEEDGRGGRDGSGTMRDA